MSSTEKKKKPGGAKHCDDDFCIPTKPEQKMSKHKRDPKLAKGAKREEIIKPLGTYKKQRRNRSPSPEPRIKYKLVGTQFEHHVSHVTRHLSKTVFIVTKLSAGKTAKQYPRDALHLVTTHGVPTT